jgi:hypothetical protein
MEGLTLSSDLATLAFPSGWVFGLGAFFTVVRGCRSLPGQLRPDPIELEELFENSCRKTTPCLCG